MGEVLDSVEDTDCYIGLVAGHIHTEPEEVRTGLEVAPHSNLGVGRIGH